MIKRIVRRFTSASSRQSIHRAMFETLEERQLLANTAPVLDAITNVSMVSALNAAQMPKSIQIPLTATDADGDPLTYTVTSSDPSIVPIIHTGNPYLKLTVEYPGDSTNSTRVQGDLYIMLYKDWSPQTTQYISSLVQAGFYDGLSFHRLVKGFMAQGGDPNGDGTGGTEFTFKDEFDPRLIFSNPGLMAMANSGDDTNSSQFFITDVPTQTNPLPRYLDFNHTIFGQLVRGQAVYQGIINSPVQAASGGEVSKPTYPVTIVSAQIIQDTADNVVTLMASKPVTSATITVSVSDGHSGIDTKTFNVAAPVDTYRPSGQSTSIPTTGSSSFLRTPMTDLYVPQGQAITIPVNATDLEGTAWKALWTITPSTAATVTDNGSSVTVVPTSDFTGVITMKLGVTKTGTSSTTSDMDADTFTISVGSQPIHARTIPWVSNAGALRTGWVAMFTSDEPGVTASDFAAIINWGDGSVLDNGEITQYGKLFIISGTHNYAHAGTTADGQVVDYPINVQISRGSLTNVAVGANLHLGADQTGARTTVQALAHVVDADTTVIGTGGDAVARQRVNFLQYGSVAAPAGRTLRATVNYGDGSHALNLPISGDGMFRLLKRYGKAGDYTITITVNDGTGTPVVQTMVVHVQAKGAVAVAGGDRLGTPLATRTLTLGTRDTAPGLSSSDYYYSISWGDGTVQTTTPGTTALGHIFAKPGNYKVLTRAYDVYGIAGPVVARTISVVSAEVATDPWNSQVKGLLVYGTDQNDVINVSVGPKGGYLVTMNGKRVGEYRPTGFLYVWGYGGNDKISVSPNLGIVSLLFGGDGNDTISGGAGYTIISGGNDNDVITGGGLRSLLIGGNGADSIKGGGQDDVLVAGATDYDESIPGLLNLMVDWVQSGTTNTYAARIAKMTNDNNGTTYAFKSTNATTDNVHDDDMVDTLIGGSGADWYLANDSTTLETADHIIGKSSGEQVLSVLPYTPPTEPEPNA